MEQQRNLEQNHDLNYKMIAEHVLDYLNRHPNSKDTLAGIAEWWLESRCIEESVEQVSLALHFLCAQEIVVKEKCIGGPVFYRLNMHKSYEDSM